MYGVHACGEREGERQRMINVAECQEGIHMINITDKSLPFNG